MKRVYLLIFVLILGGVSIARVYAETEGEAPLGLPLVSQNASQTASTSTSTQTSTTTYATVSTTAVADSQTVVDNADTGSEIYILAALSLVAGFGLYLIKKYFDLRKYTL
ncbi:MAG: hypothetical protein NTZ65_04205 [Candidatus Berkelbacteria bacterium]|nr:hypothetical protein [Candidatus Berkelbacteria bacterium]